MVRQLAVAIFVAAGIFSYSAMAAESIIGVASVIDGDTIEIHGERIRLDAIDAPESRQLCRQSDGTPWRCGQKSALALSDFMSRSTIRCEPRGHDRYRRVIAICFKGETNLNAWMVAQGWAVAFRKYGLDYVSQEDAARVNRRGMWAGSFEMPWDWRASNR
jgi:endonuclease YncB( thermonuclease family)